MDFKFLFLCLSVAVLVGCKKDQLPVLPDTNTPYYSIRGLVNNDSINWVVGIDDATLSHGISETNGVQTFYGQINSLQDEMAIKVEILRPEIVFNGTSIDAIESNQLAYLVHKPGSVKFNFGINYSQLNYFLVKDNMNDFVATDHAEFDEFGIHNVSLKFTDYGPESFTIPIKYGFEDDKLIARFNSYGDGNMLHVQPITTGGSHEWILNGELISEEAGFVKEMQNGIFTLTHKITDVNLNEAEYTTLIRFVDGSFYWQLKYFYVPPTAPSSHYGCVSVSVLKNGTWYSSQFVNSNLQHKFDVSNIETILDSNFQPQWTMFDFNFGTVLYNDSQSDSLYLPEMVGAMNVALE